MLVIDPVCETELEEETAAGTLELNGEVFHFCSQACLKAFGEEPERFAVEAGESRGDESSSV
jgi:YHS domain-containing protein